MRPRSCLFAAVTAALAISSTARAETCAAEPASVPSSITTGDFAGRLRDRIDACATDARRDAATRFCDAHRLDCTETVTRDYVRLWTLFELTRDGGPFRVRWAITNQDPTSRNVWKTWRQSPPALASTAPSAVAECDEISALFANLARKMGTRNVGLYWPTWNHTIAAWQPTPAVRVLVPTTQIFLACDDSFDHTSFSPRAQKTVFEFSAGDVPDTMTLPGALAAFLLDQTTHYAGASVEVLAAIRAHRAIRFGSSVAPACGPASADRARARAIDAGDRRALVRYGTELGLTGATAEEVLAKL